MNKTALTILVVGAFTAVALWLLSDFAVYLTHQRTALLGRPPAHGTSFVIRADLSESQDTTNASAELKAALRRRFDKFGTTVFLQGLPDSRIHVVVPFTEPKAVAAARSLVSTAGHLEFHIVAPDSDQLVKDARIPAGFELLQHSQAGPAGTAYREMVVVQETPAAGLTSNIIEKAMVSRDSMGNPNIAIQLNHASTAAFAALTRTNIGNRLAIVLDGQLNTAPVIRSEIKSGYAQIAGSFDARDALLMAVLIECPLPVPVTVEEIKTY